MRSRAVNVGKRVMSAPVSVMMTSAVRMLTRGWCSWVAKPLKGRDCLLDAGGALIDGPRVPVDQVRGHQDNATRLDHIDRQRIPATIGRPAARRPPNPGQPAALDLIGNTTPSPTKPLRRQHHR